MTSIGGKVHISSHFFATKFQKLLKTIGNVKVCGKMIQSLSVKLINVCLATIQIFTRKHVLKSNIPFPIFLNH